MKSRLQERTKSRAVTPSQGLRLSSPGKQTDSFIVCFRTDKQLPGPKFLDVTFQDLIPRVAHQDLQGLNDKTGKEQEADRKSTLTCASLPSCYPKDSCPLWEFCTTARGTILRHPG
jgi:hypothetical protein